MCMSIPDESLNVTTTKLLFCLEVKLRTDLILIQDRSLKEILSMSFVWTTIHFEGLPKTTIFTWEYEFFQTSVIRSP